MWAWSILKKDIATLHDLPIFLPMEFIVGSLLPTIVLVSMGCFTTYQLSYKIIEAKASEKVQVTKTAYQVTNFLFNLVIGILGLYLEYWVLPTLSSFGGTDVDRIPWNHKELYLVSAMQLGYQLWAIPIGVFLVGEKSEMIFHHIAVVICTFLSGFLTVGFRYYTPFFYGVMELSSLPLSLMNAFKDHPDMIKKYPTTYKAIRIVFALSFLVIRVFMCVARWPPFLRDNFLYLHTAEFGYFKLYLTIQWSLAMFLVYLQLLWALLIVKGLFKMAVGNRKKTQ